MKHLAVGITLGVLLAAVGTGLAAPGDQTIKGDLTVKGDTYTRSVQSTGPTISNITDLTVGNNLTAHRTTVEPGGYGIAWQDTPGHDATRIVAGAFSTLPNLPASSLLITRDPAQLWFRTDTAWTCIAGCS